MYEPVGGRWYPIYKDGNKVDFWTKNEIFKFYPDLLNGERAHWYPAAPVPSLLAALGEVRTRQIIPDMVQDIIVNGTAPETAVKTAHDEMVEVFKARGAAV